MEVIQGILGLAAIIGISILLSKAKSAASRALTQKVFLRTQYEEGKHILAGLTVETKASIPAVMGQLQRHVAAADSPNAVTGRLYVALRKDDRIDYVYGNKLGDSFKVTVILTARSGMTVGVFKVLGRHEQDGVIVGEKVMANLRDQVMTAFTAADPSARIVEGIRDAEFSANQRETRVESGHLTSASDPTGVLVGSSERALSNVPLAEAATEDRHVVPDPVSPSRVAGPNQPSRYIGIALFLVAVVWIALGVRVSMLPIWFGVMAAAGLASYLSSRPARKPTVGDLAPGDGGVNNGAVLERATGEAMDRTADAGAQRVFDSPCGAHDSWRETQTAQESSPEAAPAREAVAAAVGTVTSRVGVARAWFSALSTKKRAFVLVAVATVILISGIAIGGGVAGQELHEGVGQCGLRGGPKQPRGDRWRL